MAGEWIKIHKELQNSWLWQSDKPYDERSAWIDLLLSANHVGTKMLYGSELISVQKGEFITSIRNLSERWKWSKNKVSNFLNLLEAETRIKRKSEQKGTLVTIVNYGLYEDCEDTKRTPKGHLKGHQKDTKGTPNFDETADEFFEKIWQLYPIPRGKGAVSKTKRETLQKIGFDEIKRCIERYTKEMEGTDKQFWKRGSTFFNSGYVDYLDKNYKEGGQQYERDTSKEDFGDELLRRCLGEEFMS